MSETKDSKHKHSASDTFTILLAHGSSDTDWCSTFERMTKETCSTLNSVAVAYMELSRPSLESVVRDASSKGYTQITVVPLFLAAGKHLKLDIPKILNKLKIELGICYTLLPPVGEHPMMSFAIKEIVTEAMANSEKH